MAPRRVADDALRKALPHDKSKVHLWERTVKTDAQWKVNKMVSSQGVKAFVKKGRKRKGGKGKSKTIDFFIFYPLYGKLNKLNLFAQFISNQCLSFFLTVSTPTYYLDSYLDMLNCINS